MDLKHFTKYEEDFAIMIVGSFNPSIQHPEWYIRQGVVSEDATWKVKVVSEEVAQFTINELRITCTRKNLSISVNGLAHMELVLDTINSVCSLLNDTPMRACGVNITRKYDVADEDYWHRIGHTLVPKAPIWEDLGEKPGMNRLEIKYESIEEFFPGAINIFVFPPARKKIQIQTNHHCDLIRDIDDANSDASIQRLFEFLEYAKTESIEVMDKIEGKLDSLEKVN